MEGKGSSFILLHVNIQFPQHHLLKRLSFLIEEKYDSWLPCQILVDHICVGLFLGFQFCSIGGFFSIIYCENLVEFLEVNFTKLYPPCPQVLLKFLTLRVVHTEPSANCRLQFQFSYVGNGSCELCLWVSALVSHDSLYLPVFPFYVADSSFHCVLPSYRFKKSYWFFSVFKLFAH